MKTQRTRELQGRQEAGNETGVVRDPAQGAAERKLVGLVRRAGGAGTGGRWDAAARPARRPGGAARGAARVYALNLTLLALRRIEPGAIEVHTANNALLAVQ